MTIEREEPGVIIAVCDDCGERVELEAAEEDDAHGEMESLGWMIGKPSKVKYGFLSGNSQTYANDLCGDCRAGEARPEPKRGSGRVASNVHIVDDPCDEWPRSKVFAAAGLRPDCGHPRGPVGECGFCRAGRPIGDTRPDWRRA